MVEIFGDVFAGVLIAVAIGIGGIIAGYFRKIGFFRWECPDSTYIRGDNGSFETRIGIHIIKRTREPETGSLHKGSQYDKVWRECRRHFN